MPTPVDHDSREVLAFLRGPVGVNTFCFGTIDAVRGGVQHHGLMVSVPEVADPPLDDFGITQSGGFQVEIADDEQRDWFLLWQDGGYVLWEDLNRITMES